MIPPRWWRCFAKRRCRPARVSFLGAGVGAGVGFGAGAGGGDGLLKNPPIISSPYSSRETWVGGWLVGYPRDSHSYDGHPCHRLSAPPLVVRGHTEPVHEPLVSSFVPVCRDTHGILFYSPWPCRLLVVVTSSALVFRFRR